MAFATCSAVSAPVSGAAPRAVDKAIREIERVIPNSRQARYHAAERAAEEAAIYRDRLKALERLQIEQGV